MYDYNDIEDVERNLPRGTFIAIGIAILIYTSVSLMATLQLTPEQLVQHEETALAKAVSNIPALGVIGFILVILSALKSTSSGINATLFGASRLAHRIATEEEMPRIFSFRDHRGIPRYSLIIMGSLTAAFAAVGALTQITEFGSVVFLIAYGAANYACLRLWREADANPVWPALGLAGCVVALLILIRHLYVTQRAILIFIGAIFVGLLIAELVFIRREPIREELAELAEIADGGSDAGAREDAQT